MEIYKLKNALDWVYNAAYNWHSWRTIPFTMFLGELFSHNLELFVKFWFGHHSNQSQMHGRLALIAVCPDETFLNTYWAVINKRVVDKVSSLRKVLLVRRVEKQSGPTLGGYFLYMPTSLNFSSLPFMFFHFHSLVLNKPHRSPKEWLMKMQN